MMGTLDPTDNWGRRLTSVVVTEIQYVEMLERLFARIGAQLDVSITRYSFGKWEHHEYRSGDLTYTYNSAFQVTVCMWLDSLHSRCEPVSSPIPIVTPDQEAAFEQPLREAVEKLLQQANEDKGAS